MASNTMGLLFVSSFFIFIPVLLYIIVVVVAAEFMLIPAAKNISQAKKEDKFRLFALLLFVVFAFYVVGK